MKTNKWLPLFTLSVLATALSLAGCGGDSGGAGFEFTGYEDPVEADSNSQYKVSNSDPLLFEPANVIADFENIEFIQEPANGWVITGAFADDTGWDELTKKLDGARVGTIAVSTCEINGSDCDSNTGSILTPPFTINQDYINFLMTGGATQVGAQLRLANTETVLLSFQPNSCDKPVLSGNDDWYHFDVRALQGQEVQLYLFDNEEGGCGFVAFDHFYQSSAAFGTTADSAGDPTAGTGVTLPGDGVSNIIGTFDDAVQMATSTEFGGQGWVATGDFANPQTPGAWQGASVSAGAAKIGERAFSSCSIYADGCNALTGTITSAPFEIVSDYIYLLATGGADSNDDVGMELLRASTNEVLLSFTPKTCRSGYLESDQDWFKVDVSEIKGQTVKVRVFDRSTEACGHIAVDHIYQSDNASFEDNEGNVITPNEAGQAEIPAEFQADNASVASDTFEVDQVIGDFNDAQAMLQAGWQATGAFAMPASPDAWRGTAANDVAARIGNSSVSTCEINDNAEGCDAPTGTLTSPPFNIEHQYLYFLMAGGNGDAPVGIRIMNSIGEVLHEYSPNSCGPSHIDGDDDWTYIDMLSLQGAMARVQLFDEEAGGCGFVSFDHVYQTSRDPNAMDGSIPSPMLIGGAVDLTDAQIANLSFGFSLPFVDSNDQVIGRFDTVQEALDNGWLATGVFADSVEDNAWEGTTRLDAAAHVGMRAISTCEINDNAQGCDAPTGTLTSPLIAVTADKPLLSFAMAGGNGSAMVGLRVLDADDSVIETFIPNSCGPSHIDGDDDWVTLDLSAQAGSSVRVQVFDDEPGGCGFVSVDHIHFSNGERFAPISEAP